MGQQITVRSRPGIRPEVMHFELNRSLTGMQTERYPSADAATGTRPPDELARRLFDLGATGVTIYSSVVTVTAPPDRWPGLQPEVEEAIANLFIYYRQGGRPAGVVAGDEPTPAASSGPATEVTST